MKFLYVYLFGLAVLLVLACISLYFSYKRFKESEDAVWKSSRSQRRTRRKERKSFGKWMEVWFSDFSSELVGAFLTTMIFGLLVTVVQTSQQEVYEKNRLLSQLGSENHNVTAFASEELLSRGWLRDGSLQSASLIGANLEGLFLKGADMEGALVNWANLKGVSLIGANLQGTNFFAADLCGAVLAGANLQDAKLTGTDLRGADFYGANLSGATLFQSDVRGANFTYADFDEHTVLPDGTNLDPDMDELGQIDIFTNPNNAGFIPFYDSYDSYKSQVNPDCHQFRPADLPR